MYTSQIPQTNRGHFDPFASCKAIAIISPNNIGHCVHVHTWVLVDKQKGAVNLKHCMGTGFAPGQSLTPFLLLSQQYNVLVGSYLGSYLGVWL